MAAVTQRTGKVLMLYPEQLRERKANNRFDFGDIDGLGKSMIMDGIQTPLKVRKTKDKLEDGWPIYEVVDGHRRTRAAKRVASKMPVEDFVPVIVMPDDATEIDCILTALITGEHGKQRNMLEASLDIQALVKGGMKQSDVAKRIGKSAMYVSDCILLQEKASPALIKQIKDGQVTPYTAVDMLKNASSDVIEEAVDKATKKKADKAKEEAVTNPDKKANTKTTLKRSDIEEQHGAPLTAKGKKASTSAQETSKKTAGSEVNEIKEDATLTKLIGLRTAMKANAGKRKENSFDMLSALIAYGKGKATALDFLSMFFFEIDAEEDTDHLKKAKPGKVVSTIPEEEAPAVAEPIAKKDAKKEPAAPAKKVAPAKGKKTAAPVEDDEPDEVEDIDELDEEDDFEE